MKPDASIPEAPHLAATATRSAEPCAGNAVARKTLDSRTLLGGSEEIVITHGAETYRLRLTRQNRLILTK